MSDTENLEDMKNKWKSKINETIKKLDIENKRIQTILQEKEDILKKQYSNPDTRVVRIYPSLHDPSFNKKIALKKEFNESVYEPLLYDDLDTKSNQSCNTSEFELAPHQVFVRNFLSHLTPYNNLLLFHGLGTGKTCSAISICEDMRKQNKKIHNYQKIYIIANPNVQQNFRKQLFSPENLVKVNGVWTLMGCVGQRLLKDIPFPDAYTHKQLSEKIQQMIDLDYEVVGYVQFANMIQNYKKDYGSKYIKTMYSNSMIVVDEVHNIKENQADKIIAKSMKEVIKLADNLKLLFLSATPMYNNYNEIIFILNLFHMNDRRPLINASDFFDKKGNLIVDENGEEIGKQRFIEKTRGYVSFVRGANILTFPYRIYPLDFDPVNSVRHEDFIYPSTQLNGDIINKPIEYLDIYVNVLHTYQQLCYLSLMDSFNAKQMKNSAWEDLKESIECLNIVYYDKSLYEYSQKHSIDDINTDDIEHEKVKKMIGKKGLQSCMSYNGTKLSNFKYKSGVLPIFKSEYLQSFSGKIHKIIESISNSTGVVLVFSRFIEAGCIPVALALESMGITRYKSNNSLFESAQTQPIDVHTMKPKHKLTTEQKTNFKPAKYIMITGNSSISKSNTEDIQVATNLDNKYGEQVKVIIISNAGAEGIDFKFIRQIHILDPWYNNNRNEQIIGRAVRFCSHSTLPLEERNVQIYVHGTMLKNNRIETLDMYTHRLAETKAVQIGKIARILKTNSVDCILNKNVSDMSVDTVKTNKMITLSNKKKLDFSIGDKPYSDICDYQPFCSYQCESDIDMKYIQENTDKRSHYKEFVDFSTDRIIQKIKLLFKSKFVYTFQDVVRDINIIRSYSEVEINEALQKLTQEKNEFVTDMFNRIGKIVQVDIYFMFQPLEVGDAPITLFDRKKPIDYKPTTLNLDIETIIQKKNKEKDVVENPSENPNINLDITENKEEIFEKFTEYFNQSAIKPAKKPNSLNWYEHCYAVLTRMSTQLNISIENLQRYIIEHIFDSLTYEEKKVVIETISRTDTVMTTIKQNIKSYIEKEYTVILNDKKYYWLFHKSNDFFEMINNKLVKTKPLITESIEDYLKTYTKNFNYNSLYGYITVPKPLFKLKVTKDKGIGATCNQAAKHKTYSFIIQTEPLLENIESIHSKINKDEYCCELEIILRHFRYTNKDKKIWFVTYELFKFINKR